MQPPTKKIKNDEKNIINKKTFFLQKQQGGLCKIHSINNLVGANAVSVERFKSLSKTFGEVFMCTKLIEKDLTCINIFRENVSIFAIRQIFDFPSFTFFNETKEMDLKILGLKISHAESPLALSWNKTHIFAMRRVQGVWFSFDSRNHKPKEENLNFTNSICFIYPTTSHALRMYKALHNYVVKNDGGRADFFFSLLKFLYFFCSKKKKKIKKKVKKYCQEILKKFSHFDKSKKNFLQNLEE